MMTEYRGYGWIGQSTRTNRSATIMYSRTDDHTYVVYLYDGLTLHDDGRMIVPLPVFHTSMQTGLFWAAANVVANNWIFSV